MRYKLEAASWEFILAARWGRHGHPPLDLVRPARAGTKVVVDDYGVSVDGRDPSSGPAKPA